MKRLEELRKAHDRLAVLVNATVVSAMDSTTSDYLRDAAREGAGAFTADELQQLAVRALAQVKADMFALTGEMPGAREAVDELRTVLAAKGALP